MSIIRKYLPEKKQLLLGQMINPGWIHSYAKLYVSVIGWEKKLRNPAKIEIGFCIENLEIRSTTWKNMPFQIIIITLIPFWGMQVKTIKKFIGI